MSNNLGSAFNFFSPFDDVLPEPTSDLSTTAAQQQLWGLYSGIVAASPAIVGAILRVASDLSLRLLGVNVCTMVSSDVCAMVSSDVGTSR